MGQVGRVITVVLEVENPEKAKADLWEAHGEGKLVAGCKVLAISNGNTIEDGDTAQDLLTDAADYLRRYHLGDSKAEFLLDRIEEL